MAALKDGHDGEAKSCLGAAMHCLTGERLKAAKQAQLPAAAASHVCGSKGCAMPCAGSPTAHPGRGSVCVLATGTGSAQTGAHWLDRGPPSVFAARKVSV